MVILCNFELVSTTNLCLNRGRYYDWEAKVQKIEDGYSYLIYILYLYTMLLVALYNFISIIGISCESGISYANQIISI